MADPPPMLPACKTKIVATIGPASESPAILEQLIRAGLTVARLNFSHGDFAWHARVIDRLRAAARAAGRPIVILADLPGPKVRIGDLRSEPVDLKRGDTFRLTTDPVPGDARRVSVNFPRLPQVANPGDTLFLNDGLLQLEVTEIKAPEVVCRVVVGGELRSRKGLNLPGIDLGLSAFTDRDRDCLEFALTHGVDAVSQSFVESAGDVRAVRAAAAARGGHPFIIAKIERKAALVRLDEILEAADGIMIARGDLGVDLPLEQIAGVQKQLLRRAMRLGKPAITATQLLESMIDNPRPTRAEATDVANAVIDGTDSVMLSAESATGRFPVEAVAMLVRIAAVAEAQRSRPPEREILERRGPGGEVDISDVISLGVENMLTHLAPAAVVIPTRTGRTARMTARFRLPVWTVAVCADQAVSQGLRFSYGIEPVQSADPADWNEFAREWVRARGEPGTYIIFVAGPSPADPAANYRLEAINVGSEPVRTSVSQEIP